MFGMSRVGFSAIGAPPGAPTLTSVSIASGTSISVSFDPPFTEPGFPVTSYRAISSPGNISVTGSSSPIVVTGLTQGTTYTFTVRATTAGGEGPASNISAAITPSTVPNAPSSVSAVRTGDGTTATVTWTAPYNGGVPIIQYRIVSNPENITTFVPVGSTSANVSGLTNATVYTFTVSAENARGYSAGTTSNSISSFTVPNTPTMVGAARTGDGLSITVTFIPSTSNGGSAITGYEFSWTNAPGWTFVPIASIVNNTSYTLTGFNYTTNYTLQIRAVNAIGNSTASSASNSVGTYIAANATGGTTSEDGLYRTHVFTSDSTFNVTSAPAGAVFEILLVGGGGGGGGGSTGLFRYSGGGGGAGGLVYYGATTLTTGTKNLTIGTAGIGGLSGADGGSGGSSTFTGLTTAIGGGFGGGATLSGSNPGGSGGSGGGGNGGGASTQTGGYGFSGGSFYSPKPGISGDGGGSQNAAVSVSSTSDGVAGSGIYFANFYPANSSISASVRAIYAAGGAGGRSTGTGKFGGSGIGGRGGSSSDGGTSTIPNTGSGGGGGGGWSNASTNGGSGTAGIIQVRYLAYNPLVIDYLVVGGGASGAGNGGNNTAGGGGAGQVIEVLGATAASGTAHNITVGAGGAGRMGDLSNGRLGLPGGSSSFLTTTANGGSPGSYGNGGASGSGNAGLTAANWGGGGQGGAASGAFPGTGVQLTTWSAAGGNAAGWFASGGSGMFGTDRQSTGGGGIYPAGGGIARTGGGSAPAAFNSGAAGNGGSGVVIIRTLQSAPVYTTTGSPTITTSGGYRFYSWGGNGSITF